VYNAKSVRHKVRTTKQRTRGSYPQGGAMRKAAYAHGGETHMTKLCTEQRYAHDKATHKQSYA